MSFFNGRLNSQIWHHKAKTHKSHPEGWCRLDCGRFMRIFFLYFSITMLKKNPMELGTLQVYNISHFFFPLQAQSHMKNSGEEKKTWLFFSFISEEMVWEGVRVEVGKKVGNTASSKSKIKKKTKQNKTHTHTENEHQFMNWRGRRKKKICEWCRLQRWATFHMKNSAEIFEHCASPGVGGWCKKKK